MSVHYLDLTHLDQGVNSCPSFGSFCVQVCRPRIAGGLWSVALGINCLLSICAQDMSLQSSHTDTSLQMLPSPTMQQPQSPNMAHGHLFHQNGPYSSNLGLKVYYSSTFTFSPWEEGSKILIPYLTKMTNIWLIIRFCKFWKFWKMEFAPCDFQTLKVF